MGFLADECCDFAVVRCLRAAGHDVPAVNEFQQKSVDRQLLDLAVSEDSPGVILIRFPASARGVLADAILKLVGENGARLMGSFVVLQPGVARINVGR
jgi:hypothetical protein